MDIRIMWISARKQLFTSRVLHLQDNSMLTMTAEQGGYRMGPPGSSKVSLTESLFVDDLNVYQESHDILRDCIY